jgi:hypothetical protein
MANPDPNPRTRWSSTHQPQNRRQPDLILAALRERMTEEAVGALADVALAKALAGDIRFFELLWDRLAGKVVARQEQGDPGAFTGLEDVPTEELVRRIEEYRKLK